MSTFLALVLIFILNLPTQVFLQKNNLTFCLVNFSFYYGQSTTACKLRIQSDTSNITCVLGTDRIDCLRRLINNEVDFAFTEPEGLIVLGMTEAYNKEVLITHEFAAEKEVSWTFKWVVVARKNIENINQVKKKRYCAPDAEKNEYTHFYTNYFEKKLITPECNPKKTLLDNKMTALSHYFESACISASWTFDYNFDTKIKRKYSSLCSQCRNPRNCSVAKIPKKQEKASSCLLSNRGDIGWFTLSNAREKFHKSRRDEFHFLCLDNTTRNLNNTHPCIWFEEPRHTIISRKEAADNVTIFLNEQIDTNGDFNEFLQTYMDPRTEVAIAKPLKKHKTPIDYLEKTYREYFSLKNDVSCKLDDRKIKWCVTTKLEAEKCKWIAFAAKSYKVEPLIECVQENSHESCLESVKNRRNDIFPINASDDSKASEGLKPIVYMVSNKNYENDPVAIVRKLSNFYSLMDLKCATACFAGYRNSGWNTFIYMMGKLTGNKGWYCNDKEMVSQFFKESCVEGLDERNTTFPKNLYSHCSNAAWKKRNSKMNTLACLYFTGDVAFLNLSANVHSLQESSTKVLTKPICLNKSMNNINKTDKCPSVWKTLGSVMVHQNISKIREEEIYLMLASLDRLFGARPRNRIPFISLYGIFAEEKNIIFPEGTQYLERKICSENCNPISYEKILEELSTHRQSCDMKTTDNTNDTHCLERNVCSNDTSLNTRTISGELSTHDEPRSGSISLILGEWFNVLIILLFINSFPM